MYRGLALVAHDPPAGASSRYTRVRVALAASHSGMRDSLRSVLERASATVVAQSDADPEAIAGAVRAAGVDVIVVVPPAGAATATVAALAERCPHAPIVAVGLDPGAPFKHKMLEAGAARCVPIDAVDDVLPAVVRAARNSALTLDQRLRLVKGAR